MGQKVNPHGARVGIIKGWDSRWFADKKEMAANIKEDDSLRKYLKKKLYSYQISKIEIERKAGTVTVFLYTAKPGALIGKGGAGIEVLKKDIAKFVGKPVNVNIMEIRKPDVDAQLVAENIAAQLEKRISFRHEGRSKGYQDSCFRPSGRRGDRAQRRLSRGQHSAADSACRYRLRLCRGSHYLRPHRRKGMGIQGRSSSAG